MSDEPGRPAKEKSEDDVRPRVGFVGSGFLLFLGTVVVSVGAWLYWLSITKLTTTSEIGNATSVSSLALLIGTLAQLGLEYPLLKRSFGDRSKILGTTLVVELAVALAFLPAVYILMESFYAENLIEFYYLAALLIVLSSVGFVARHALLGISDAKTVVILNVAGTTVKFAAGFTLVSMGYGALGILLSFVLQNFVLAVGALLVARKSFKLSLGGTEFGKKIVVEGLVNLPAKIPSVLIASFSVVLLASFGIPSSDIGIFYIVIMLSTAAGSFAINTAMMSIPASSASNRDLSSASQRIGLVFTAPLIVILIVIPEALLSVLGQEYVLGKTELAILAAGIFPLIMIRNAISKFNNTDDKKRLLILGSLLSGSFVSLFVVLVPMYGILGAAYAVTVSFALSAVLSAVWSERKPLRFVGFTGLSIVGGVIVGLAASYAFDFWALTVTLAIATTLAIVFALRCTSVDEIRNAARSLRRKAVDVSET